MSDRRLDLACGILLLVAAVAAVVTFGDFGITWDEAVQSAYGELVLDYFLSGGSDLRCNSYHNLPYYGPAFETATAALYRVVGSHKYEIRHAAIGLTALLTLVAVWRFGRRLSPATAWFAMLALVMTPRFVGHAFNNSKDVPFACAVAWGMVGAARLVARPAWAWRDVLLCGTGIGLALSIRVGALLLFGFLAAGLAASVALSADTRRAFRSDAGMRVVKGLVLLALAWAIMVGPWPWAHASPIVRPFQALGEMTDFSYSYTTWFEGRPVPSDQLPRYYIPLFLGIGTPLVLLALAALGIAVSIGRQRSRARGPDAPLLVMTQLWLLFPLVWFVATRPNVYDGMRHVLFVLPALAIFCGLGCAWLLGRARGRFKPLALLLLTLAVGLPLRDQIRLHPYQHTFFNATVGGLESAWRRFETDYWTSSYREAMRWVLRDAADRGDEPTVVAVACNTTNRPCAEYYLNRSGEGPAVSMVCVWNGDERLPAPPHYYVATLRYGKAAAFFPDWPVVHRVGREGAVFSVIKKNPAAAARSE